MWDQLDPGLKAREWCESILPGRFCRRPVSTERLETEGFAWVQRWLAAGGQGYHLVMDLLKERLNGKELAESPNHIYLVATIELAKRWEEFSYQSLHMYQHEALYSAFTLLRGSHEAVLTALYINEYPSRGPDWFDGAEFTPGQVRKELETSSEIRSLYKTLSWVAHANMVWPISLKNEFAVQQTTLGFLRALSGTNQSAASLFRSIVGPVLSSASDFLTTNPWVTWDREFDNWLAMVGQVLDRED